MIHFGSTQKMSILKFKPEHKKREIKNLKDRISVISQNNNKSALKMSTDNLNEIYQDCWLCYEDGTRFLIRTQMGEKCITPTSNPFWKMPEDVDSRVEAITQEATKKLASK